MNESAFRYLLWHEFRLELRKFFQKKRTPLYGGIVLLLIAAALTVWGKSAGFRSVYVLYLAYMLPYLTFVISFRMLLREWKGGTIGWWITLPYSRSRLLFAKFAAACLHTLLVYVLFFAAVTLLVLYGAAIHGDETGTLREMLAGEAFFSIALVGLAPLMLTLGLLMAAVAHSRWALATPLLWIVFGLTGNSLTWITGEVLPDQPDAWANAVLPGWLWASIPFAWAAAGLLLLGTIRIVSRHLKF